MPIDSLTSQANRERAYHHAYDLRIEPKLILVNEGVRILWPPPTRKTSIKMFGRLRLIVARYARSQRNVCSKRIRTTRSALRPSP